MTQNAGSCLGAFEVVSPLGGQADPRWLPFLRKLGKAPGQLAKIPFKVTLPQP